MAKNKIEGPFVALLLTTLDSPSWQALSHGSKWLHVALKRRKSNNGNRAYISYRTAQKEIKSSTKKIGARSLNHVGDIEGASSVNDVVHISSLTTTVVNSARPPPPSQPLSEDSLEEKTTVVVFDDRIIQLDETTHRLKAERRKARRAS
jgi:hypothetical protein